MQRTFELRNDNKEPLRTVGEILTALESIAGDRTTSEVRAEVNLRGQIKKLTVIVHD